jgi:uncharacterized membrane-anchored protein
MERTKWIIVLNFVLLVGYLSYALYDKEKILKDGELVLLELAPVDPRSLMQGDYMLLNYAISNQLSGQDIPTRGYCVVKLGLDKVAELVRWQGQAKPLYDGERLIRFGFTSQREFKIGAESFFFQEGRGEIFAKARYGGLRVDAGGNSLLVGLYDSLKNQIR